MFEKLEYFFVRAYQPEFHLANIALLLTMGGLMDASGRVEPITTGQCALHEHALGCFYTSELKAMPDELGILGFLAALAWTGYVGALAMKNLKISRAYLLGHGFTEEELEGVTTYTWTRYAETKANGELDVAKAFIERRNKRTASSFAHSQMVRNSTRYHMETYFAISTVNLIRALRDVLSLDRDARLVGSDVHEHTRHKTYCKDGSLQRIKRTTRNFLHKLIQVTKLCTTTPRTFRDS